MYMKKRITLLISIIMVFTMLWGCGNSNTSDQDTEINGSVDNNSSKESTSGEIVEIRQAIWDTNQEPFYTQAAEIFMKANQNIKITIEVTPWDQYWTKVEAAATGGSVADVFWMNGPNITKYARGGVISPIGEYLSESDVDMNNYPSGLVSLYNIDDAQYAIPKDFDTIAVWYNKALFDAAGVEYPTDDWTWDDMVEKAKQLTDTSKGIYGVVSQLNNQNGYYNTILANDGFIISEDKKTSGYDSTEAIEAIKLWVDLIEKGYSPTLAQQEDTTSNMMFESGMVAMIFTGSWTTPEYAGADQISETIDVVEMPTVNEKKASVIHGLGNVISSATKHPQEAWKWVEYLASQEANELQAKTGAAIPAHVVATPLWSENYPQYNLQAYVTASTDYSYPYPASENTGEWNQYETDYLKQAYSLEITVDDACRSLTEAMNEVLAAEGQ